MTLLIAYLIIIGFDLHFSLFIVSAVVWLGHIAYHGD